MKGQKGFLVLDVLIAGLILTASIAATMHLFGMGFEHLERANTSNVLSSKLPQAINLIKTLDLENKSGTEDMGDNVSLEWEASLIDKSRPVSEAGEFDILSIHELFLYRVDLTLEHKNISREYELNVFKYKTLVSPSEVMF